MKRELNVPDVGLAGLKEDLGRQRRLGQECGSQEPLVLFLPLEGEWWLVQWGGKSELLDSIPSTRRAV